MKISYAALFLILLSFIPIQAWSDSAEQLRISRLVIDIRDGNTRENAVRKWIEAEEGLLFADEESLSELLRRDVQELINLRVFQSVDFRTSVDPAGEPRDRIVTFVIQDASTFVPVPLPLYDSNTGGIQLLYVQIWDNMFGTLANWFSLATLTIREDENGKLETGPFIFAPQVNNIRAGNFVFGFRYEQERVESSRYLGTVPVADYRYDRSALFFNTEFRFGVKRRLYYTVEPGVEFRYSYQDNLGSSGYTNQPFGGQIQQALFYDSVDFYGNSRRGLRTGVTNNLRIVSYDGTWTPVTDIRAEISPYFAFGDNGRFSYYARLMGLGVIGDTYEQLGEPLRGIPDATMDGDFAVYLNQTIGISLWRWRNVWDLQIHPFFDIGLATGGTRGFSGWSDVRRSTGADILLFIEKVPNLAFRFSWGVDLDSNVAWGEDTKTEFIVRYAFSY